MGESDQAWMGRMPWRALTSQASVVALEVGGVMACSTTGYALGGGDAAEELGGDGREEGAVGGREAEGVVFPPGEGGVRRLEHGAVVVEEEDLVRAMRERTPSACRGARDRGLSPAARSADPDRRGRRRGRGRRSVAPAGAGPPARRTSAARTAGTIGRTRATARPARPRTPRRRHPDRRTRPYEPFPVQLDPADLAARHQERIRHLQITHLPHPSAAAVAAYGCCCL